MHKGITNLTLFFTEQVLRHGNSVEILVVKKQLCERLNELITAKFQGDPEENDTIYFVANQDEVIRAIETLGNIKTSQAFPNMCSVTDGQTRAIKGRNSKFTVQTRYVYCWLHCSFIISDKLAIIHLPYTCLQF
jgi:hypothetical protein